MLILANFRMEDPKIITFDQVLFTGLNAEYSQLD